MRLDIAGTHSVDGLVERLFLMVDLSEIFNRVEVPERPLDNNIVRSMSTVTLKYQIKQSRSNATLPPPYHSPTLRQAPLIHPQTPCHPDPLLFSVLTSRPILHRHPLVKKPVDISFRVVQLQCIEFERGQGGPEGGGWAGLERGELE